MADAAKPAVHFGPIRLGRYYGAMCGATAAIGKSIAMTTTRDTVGCIECLRRLGPKRPGDV